MVTHEPTAPDSVPVPAATYEAQTWIPADQGYYSRAELRRQRGTYHSIVTAPLAGWQPNLTNGVTADVEDGTRALADFDRHALQVLGAESPALVPMSAILLRTESTSSSQIENLTTSARQLALAEIGQTEKANAQTVIGNVRAMEAALRLSDHIESESILTMHLELLRHQRGFEHHAGRFRQEAVWIGKDNAGPIGADFVAPRYERIPEAIQDIVDFADRDDLPVLVQVATAHAQFETIHPFVDGNGRTGRALAQAMLRSKGLVTHVTVPISAGLLTNTDTYFDALNAFREGDAGPIVHRFADAARFAAASGRTLVDNLAAQLADARDKLAGVRTHATAWAVLPRLIGQPVVNSKYLTAELAMNDVTAMRALEILVERGVLVECTGLKRNRVWQHTGILDVLDDYASLIRRAAP
ncbi:Fic family protein [Winogradskya consettensis]|uniref:Fic family protein n=1 Tax=Winogradskya consettensis TaxID=113560 RepID=A0A919SEX0_9ACTN|nr:Fic family protein [Actinoplanes consettensis]GIM71415.1 Fic family protein [Actinoplanes consettensis]